MDRPTKEMVQIVAAGGGITVSALTQTTTDLVQIAAAGAGRATIHITHVDAMSTDELVRIAAAGGGSVIFEP